MSDALSAAGPVLRFGRTETWTDERGHRRIWWTIYEALDRDDFKRGMRVAAFERHPDALAFMAAFESPA